MAKKDSSGRSGDARAEGRNSEKVAINGGDIITPVQGAAGVSFEDGYPSIANADMHNNQGRGGARLKK